jgi:hypothetical protein
MAAWVVGDRVRKKKYAQFGTIHDIRVTDSKTEVLVSWDGEVRKKVKYTAQENLVRHNELQTNTFPEWARELMFSETQQQRYISSSYLVSHEFNEACAESDALQRTLGLTQLERSSAASKITVQSNRSTGAGPRRYITRYWHI